MIDRSISAISTIALFLWAGGLTLVVFSIILDDHGWGQLGLLAAGLGAVLNIRKFLCDMDHRERAAFHLGLERGRRDEDNDTVRPISRH